MVRGTARVVVVLWACFLVGCSPARPGKHPATGTASPSAKQPLSAQPSAPPETKQATPAPPAPQLPLLHVPCPQRWKEYALRGDVPGYAFTDPQTGANLIVSFAPQAFQGLAPGDVISIPGIGEMLGQATGMSDLAMVDTHTLKVANQRAAVMEFTGTNEFGVEVHVWYYLVDTAISIERIVCTAPAGAASAAGEVLSQALERAQLK